jgi:hypothetical protein
VDLRFSLPGDEGGGGPSARVAPGHVRVSWLYGRVSRELRAGARRGPRARRGLPPVAELVRAWNDGAGDAILRLARSARRFLHVKGVQARARLGLGDPADTGLLFGIAGPLALALRRGLPSLELELEPDFRGPVLDGELRGEVRVVPLAALPHLARFALSPATLRAVRRLRAERR